ncbi:MAG: cell division protein FtsZ [Bacteroidetes bacterium]|nr:cell division protein FtsZ [Bacteroidota bacterium]
MELLRNNNEASIIKVFGVGGGGSNAVNHMYQQGIKGVDFVICNTDAQALELSPVPNKLQIGNNLTDGRGAGSEPEVGRKAAQESTEDIQKILKDGTKMVFITAGMGGGTGTGAAPVIAKLARDLGILTVGIITVPFGFEGKRRKTSAIEGLENLKEHVDTLIVVENEKLRQMYGNLTMSSAFSHADNILTTAAKGIAEIITVPGYINVDFEDVKTVMSNSGVAIMGSAVAEGEDRALRAVEGALLCPLLSESNIQGAKHILLNITSGLHEITMDEISIITDYIQEESGTDADMIWGHCYDETMGNHIMVTVIATGFEGKSPKASAPKVEEKIVHNLTEEKSNMPMVNIPNMFGSPVSITPPASIIEEPVLKEEESFFDEELFKPLSASFSNKKEETEDDKLERIRRETDFLKTHNGLTEIEKEPAFQRRKIKLREIQHSSESSVSKLSLTDDFENPIGGNSFLHDNID